MSYRSDLNDSTGLCPLRPGTGVRITHPLAAYTGEVGKVERVDKVQRTVWVRLQIEGAPLVRVKHRSVTVVP
jgi:hypothetical protein